MADIGYIIYPILPISYGSYRIQYIGSNTIISHLRVHLFFEVKGKIYGPKPENTRPAKMTGP